MGPVLLSSIEDQLNKPSTPPEAKVPDEHVEEHATSSDTQHIENGSTSTQGPTDQTRDVQLSEELVTALVNQYSLSVRYLLTGTSSFEKKIVKARANFAAIPSDEVPLFLEDHTLFGSYKEGLVVTDKALYINGADARGRFLLNCVTSIEVTYNSKIKLYYLNLCFPSSGGDGSLVKIIASCCSGESDMDKLVSFWRNLIKLK